MLGDFGGKSVTASIRLSDPNEVTLLEEWESRDQVHGRPKYGDQFNATAGTEGLEWETRIWRNAPVRPGRSSPPPTS